MAVEVRGVGLAAKSTPRSHSPPSAAAAATPSRRPVAVGPGADPGSPVTAATIASTASAAAWSAAPTSTRLDSRSIRGTNAKYR